MHKQMSDLESQRPEPSANDYDHSAWPRDFDFSVECSEQKEVMNIFHHTQTCVLQRNDKKACQ